MSKYTFVVCTKPVEGREDEYNQWYNNKHIPDILRVPGCVAAQRYQVADGSDARMSGFKYICIYEWEAESAQACRDALDTARAAGDVDVSEALDSSATALAFFEPIE